MHSKPSPRNRSRNLPTSKTKQLPPKQQTTQPTKTTTNQPSQEDTLDAMLEIGLRYLNIKEKDYSPYDLVNKRENGYRIAAIFRQKQYPVYIGNNTNFEFNEIFQPDSLFVQQMIQICGRLLYFQYHAFDGFSAIQTFLSCLYFYPDLVSYESKDYRVLTFYHTMRLFYLAFITYQGMCHQVFSAKSIISSEFIEFDLNRLRSFDGKELQLLIPLNQLITFDNSNFGGLKYGFIQSEIIYSTKFINPKEKVSQNDSEAIKLLQRIAKYESKLARTFLLLAYGKANSKSPLQVKDQLIINTSKTQTESSSNPQKDKGQPHQNSVQQDNTQQIDKEIINDTTYQNTTEDPLKTAPGFCDFMIMDETNRKKDRYYDTESFYLNSTELNEHYENLNESFKNIARYISSIKEVSSIEELVKIFIQWNSKNLDVPTVVRFCFFKKIFPDWTQYTIDVNTSNKTNSNILGLPHKHYFPPKNILNTFQNFITYTEDCIKTRFNHSKTSDSLSNIEKRVILLLTQFFSYSLRLMIFRSYKVQKVFIRTIIPQWIKNMTQMSAYDSQQKDGIFTSNNKPTPIKDFFYSMLQDYFKYYFSYSFYSGILNSNDSRYLIEFYLFLIIHYTILYYTKRDYILLLKEEIKQANENTKSQKGTEPTTNSKFDFYFQGYFVHQYIESFLTDKSLDIDDQKIDINQVITKEFKIDQNILGRAEEIKVYHCCFDIILYKYIFETDKPNEEEAIQSAISAFNQLHDFNIYIIKKNLDDVLYDKSTQKSRIPDYPLYDAFDNVKTYFEKSYKRWYGHRNEFKQYITEEFTYIQQASQCSNEGQESKELPNESQYQDFHPFLNLFLEIPIQSFLNDPTSFKFDIQNATYPFLTKVSPA